jgi:hypothetical protein
MPCLTVFLVRSGETVKEVNVSDTGRLRHHQKVDPSLTYRGYRQAQDTLTALVQGICARTPIPPTRGDSDNDGVIDPLRNMACFAAPLRSCQSTAMMMSTTGLEQQDKLTWRYTTVEAAKSPSAVPVLTVNGLCSQEEEIKKCGGIEAVTNGGLLHTAAASWNDARNKCPFMEVCVRDMKNSASNYVKSWKKDRNVYPPRRVLDVQYMYIQDAKDPWSLNVLTPKVNISIDMLEVEKYLPPPRKGNIEYKLQKGASSPPLADTFEVVSNCVTMARQVGCDTIVFVVPTSVMQSLINKLGGSDGAGKTIQAPCSVMTLTANVDDATEKIDWNLYGVFTSDQLRMNPIAAVPTFNGTVNCIVPPPNGKDPSQVPPNQWSKFPPPEPEYIPDDYPDLYVLQFVFTTSSTYVNETNTSFANFYVVDLLLHLHLLYHFQIFQYVDNCR